MKGEFEGLVARSGVDFELAIIRGAVRRVKRDGSLNFPASVRLG